MTPLLSRFVIAALPSVCVNFQSQALDGRAGTGLGTAPHHDLILSDARMLPGQLTNQRQLCNTGSRRSI